MRELTQTDFNFEEPVRATRDNLSPYMQAAAIPTTEEAAGSSTAVQQEPIGGEAAPDAVPAKLDSAEAAPATSFVAPCLNDEGGVEADGSDGDSL